MNNLMTTKETADYLRLNYMTVYKMAQRGQVPATKVGGAWRFKKELLDDWIVHGTTRASATVLVVDDDPEVRELLQEIVATRGHKVLAVETGEEALEALTRRHFDLIFLDLVLPGISGVETLEEIKARDKKAAAVIVTGCEDSEMVAEAVSLGPLMLLRKPFKVEDVVEVITVVARTSGG